MGFSSQGRTVLHEAVISGRSMCFNIILKQSQLKINAQDNQGWPPLFWAVNRKAEHLVQDLITAGCDIMHRDLSKNTALHEVGCYVLSYYYLLHVHLKMFMFTF